MKRGRGRTGAARLSIISTIAVRMKSGALALGTGVLSATVVSCTSYYEVPIEVPISAKLDWLLG